MGRVRPPVPVIYFCALLHAPSIAQAEVESVLEVHFGSIVFRSANIPFTQTTYYEREMGSNLTRLYLGFAPLRSMGDLAAVKHTTNQLETQWAIDDCRLVNIDPGYLDHAKVVLVTTKDYSHRLYILAVACMQKSRCNTATKAINRGSGHTRTIVSRSRWIFLTGSATCIRGSYKNRDFNLHDTRDQAAKPA